MCSTSWLILVIVAVYSESSEGKIHIFAVVQYTLTKTFNLINTKKEEVLSAQKLF